MKFAACTIILLAVFNINNAISLSGSKYTLRFFYDDFVCTVLSICNTQDLQNANQMPVQEATIYLSANGYSPKSISIPRSSQVKINLVNNTGVGCIQAFTIPKLNIQKVIPQGTSDYLVFNSPAIPQDLKFTCDMGMYEGVIHVI